MLPETERMRRSEAMALHGAFLDNVLLGLSPAARGEFREIEQATLALAMDRCGLAEYPAVVGRPDGERASGDCVCPQCGQDYFSHPMDWRVIGYGDVPFLNILCNGERVKL